MYDIQWKEILSSIKQGETERVILLLNEYTKRVKMNQEDEFESAALHMAVEYGHALIVSHLLKLEFSVNAFKKGYSVLHIAAKKGFIDIVSQLVKVPHINIDIQDQVEAPYLNGRTPLSFAAEYGYLDLCQYLLNAGANINARDHTGRTPLFYAVVWKHGAVTQHLLEKGARVDIKNYTNRTVLHEITRARFTSYKIIQLLTWWGADWEEKDETGKTPYALLSEHNAKVVNGFEYRKLTLQSINNFLIYLFTAIRGAYQLNEKVSNRMISFFLRVHADWLLLYYTAYRDLNKRLENTKNITFAEEIKELIVVKTLLYTMEKYYDIHEVDGQLVIDAFFWKFKRNKLTALSIEKADKRGLHVQPLKV
jgi:hypothetical protein